MIKNKYYIISQIDVIGSDDFVLDLKDMDSVFNYTVEKNMNYCRTNNLKTKIIVKLPVDSIIPELFKDKPSYSNEEILIELEKDEWGSKEI